MGLLTYQSIARSPISRIWCTLQSLTVLRPSAVSSFYPVITYIAAVKSCPLLQGRIQIIDVWSELDGAFMIDPGGHVDYMDRDG